VSGFVTHGAVPLGDNHYVRRSFEDRVFLELTKRRWVLLLGPRQHGKTSGLGRLAVRLREQGLSAALVDLQLLPPLSNFLDLIKWFATQVRAQVKSHILASGSSKQAPENPDLYEWLEWAVDGTTTDIALVIDEASGIHSPDLRNSFYGQFRAIANKRATDPQAQLAKRLSCVFSGTFRPESLVAELNSPFNVCTRIETEGLGLAGIKELATFLKDKNLDLVSTKTFEATAGQPFLTQVLLACADDCSPGSEGQALDTAVNALVTGVEQASHFEDLFKVVISDDGLASLVATLCSKGSLPLDVANPDLNFLRVLGLIRRDGGTYVFTNELYRRIAVASPQLNPSAKPDATGALLLPLPVEHFDFIKDSDLREFVYQSQRGAVRAYSETSFRLALVGYGCALEGVLIHLLERIPAGELATAISAAKSDSKDPAKFQAGLEDEKTPRTHRLVNLARVARKVSGIHGKLDIPNALREWRNLVHPAAVLKNYIPESKLEPEARQASGMLSMVRRDVMEKIK
jgi:hypothetical protein